VKGEQTIHFGAVYIIEQEYSDLEIQKDLQTMRDSGYDLITLWPVANAWLTSNSHEFIYSQTKKVMDYCQKLGIQVILQLFGQNQAQEFMPDTLSAPSLEAQNDFTQGFNENCYWANLNHPTVRHCFENYFESAITALKNHPALYGWDIFNEAHFRSDDPWTTDCYQQWLEKKYGAIDTLNLAWYRRYDGFSQIRPEKRRTPYSIWSSLLPAIDYEKFRSENLTDICRFLYMTAKRWDPQHPIIIDGTSAQILDQHILMRNNDEFETAKIPDIYGATFYPKSWGRNFKETPWNLSLYYLIPSSAAKKANKPYAVNELQTHTQSALTPGSEVNPNELRDWIWMCIFTGPSLIQLWRWRPFLHGYQITGRGLTQFDGSPNARCRAVTQLLKTMKDNAPWFSNCEVEKPTVSLAISYHCRLAFDSLLKWQDSYYPEIIKGWNRLLWNLGLQVGISNTEELDSTDFATPVLILPSTVQVSKKETKTLQDYVFKGGCLIADCRLGVMDEMAVAPSEGIPGVALSQLFGIKECEVSSKGSYTLDDVEIQACHMHQILELEKNTKVLARMTDGNPAIVEHSYGAGKTLYLNSFVGLGLSGEIPSALRDCIGNWILDTAGVQRIVKSDLVHTAKMKSDTGSLLLVVNFDSSKEGYIQLVVKKGVEIENLMTGEHYCPQPDGLCRIAIGPDSCQVLAWRS
jgi:beta-galactosidase